MVIKTVEQGASMRAVPRMSLHVVEMAGYFKWRRCGHIPQSKGADWAPS
jgi:hypothetical protein